MMTFMPEWKEMTFAERCLTVVLFVPVFCVGKFINVIADGFRLKKKRNPAWRSEV
jgi:hypothetical protein